MELPRYRGSFGASGGAISTDSAVVTGSIEDNSASGEAGQMIMVVGMPSGGTSVVAGLLHHLGVDMGRFERGIGEGERKYEGFECLDCWQGAIRHAYEPAEADDFMKSFAQYLKRRTTEAKGPFGVKHNPLVWLGMFDGIETLPVRIVHVHRPLDEIMRSDRKYRGDDLARAARMGMSHLAMNRLIELLHPKLSLTFAGILEDAASAVDSLVAELQLSPSFGQMERAREFVNPTLRHV